MHREEESRAREQKSKPAAGRAEQNNSVVDPLGVVRVSAVAAVATLWPADPLRPRNRHRNVNAAVVSGHWSRFPTRNHHDEAQRISFASDQPWYYWRTAAAGRSAHRQTITCRTHGVATVGQSHDAASLLYKKSGHCAEAQVKASPHHGLTVNKLVVP
jgi:hypothetical protein